MPHTTPSRRLALGEALFLIIGCATAPAPTAPVAGAPPTATEAPAAAPTADPRHPLGPPETLQATFGPVEETYTLDERAAVYDVREFPFIGKPPAGWTGMYVRLGGAVHGVHWDSAATFAGLAPGTTVNLHPAPHVVCVEDPSHPAGVRCWRLVYVYPGKRFQPPLTGS